MAALAPTPAPYPAFRSAMGQPAASNAGAPPDVGSNGSIDPRVAKLTQIGEALKKADAAGNVDDARVLARGYRTLQAQMMPGGQSSAGQQTPTSSDDMISLNIEGKNVRVGREFLSMSPEERNQAVDEIASQAGIQRASNGSRPMQSVAGSVGGSGQGQPDAMHNGIMANIGAAPNDVIDTTLGAPVDAARTVINAATQPNQFARNLPIVGPIFGAGQAISQAFGGVPEIPDTSFGGRKSIAQGMSHLGVTDPDTVQANTEVEKILRATAAGASYAVAPDAMISLLGRAGIIGDKAAAIMAQVFGKSDGIKSLAGNAFAGASAGGAGQAGYDAAPDNLKPLMATIGGLAGGGIGTGLTALPRLASAGTRIASDYLAPVSQAGRERLAGKQLNETATSPGSVIDTIARAPSMILPGSKPTTGQLTGDMGLLGAERAAQTKDPIPFQQRRADQNAARVSALEGIQPTGGPEQVVSAVRQHMADIEQQAQTAIDTATNAARSRTAALGQGKTPEMAGGDLRAAYEAARATAKGQERTLWQAVDPQGTLALPATATRSQASQIIKAMPATAKPMEGDEGAIFKAASGLGNVAKFSDITALQSRIKTEMRAEKLANGESPAYGRLVQLNAAVQHDLEGAVAQKAQQEQQAVAAGQMQPEQTMMAALQRQVDAWRELQGGQVSSQSAVGVDSRAGAPRARPVSPTFRATGEVGGRFGSAAGDQRVPQDGRAPNFDAAALDRLKTAIGSTRERLGTFDNKTLAPMRRRPATTAPYDMPDAGVAQRLFAPGPKSFEAINTYRNAVGDQHALDALSGFAVDRLRRVALREDGTLDPAKLAAFRRSHSDALRALPELDAAIADAGTASETMGMVAEQQRDKVAEANTGALAKLMKLDDPADVTRTVGSIFGRQDAAKAMFGVKLALGKSPEARDGLRKAVVDHMMDRFVGNIEAATSGVGAMKSDQFQSFIAQNRPALRAAGFTSDELGTMENIAEDLRRSNRSNTAVRVPGQSNTAQDVLAAKPNDSTGSTILKVLLGGASAGSGYIAFGGGLSGTAAAATASIGAGLVAALRQHGLRKVSDLVREALLDPALARHLMMKASPGNAKLVAASLRHRLASSSAANALVSHGHQNAA